MLLVGAIVGVTLTIAFALNGWFGGPRRRATPPATPVPKELAERLGPGLAAFLGAARGLHREFVVLEAAARTMLAIEIRDRAAAAAEPRPRSRPVHKQVDDATFLAHLRRVREAGRKLLAQYETLGPSTALERVEFDPTQFAAWCELPWGLTAQHDAKPDRSDELGVVLAAVLGASAALARVDALLSASPPTTYR